MTTSSVAPPLHPAVAGADALADPAALALKRLAASRQQLRLTLIPPPEPAAAPGAAWYTRLPQGLRTQWRQWRSARGWPLLDLAGDGLQRWWQAQPWRPVGEALGGEAATWLRNAVRRHPVASAALAAAAGALVVRARAWRWSLLRRPAQRVPVLAGRWLQGQLAQPAVMAMLAGLLLQTVQRQPSTTSGPAATADPGRPTGPAAADEMAWYYGGTPPPEPSPSAAQPAVAQPSATQPSATQPSATQPSATQPVAPITAGRSR